jgi:hypothetical protein
MAANDDSVLDFQNKGINTGGNGRSSGCATMALKTVSLATVASVLFSKNDVLVQ